MCTPLSAATVRRIHFAVRGVLTAAERWGWITSNAAVVARKPRAPVPQPDPPTVAQAARIIDAAWAEDDGWGTLVWLVISPGRDVGYPPSRPTAIALARFRSIEPISELAMLRETNSRCAISRIVRCVCRYGSRRSSAGLRVLTRPRRPTSRR